LIKRYLSFGYTFTDVGSPTYNPFQEKILSLCRNTSIPGGCDLFLRNYCDKLVPSNVVGQTDSADISFCGCYLPSPYKNVQYSTRDNEQDRLSTQCTPLCHLITTVQRSKPCTGEIIQCENTVCVIDNVNVELAKGTTAAFQQICPGCDQAGADPCTCIIGGPDPRQTIIDSGVAETYTQYCGTNANCYQLDSTGTLRKQTCPDASSFQFGIPTLKFPLIAAIVVAVVVIIFLLVFFLTRHGKSPKYKVEQVRTGSSRSR